MKKITKISKQYVNNTYTGEPIDYYYLVIISDSKNPFKTKTKKVSKEVFTEREFYIGRKIY